MEALLTYQVSRNAALVTLQAGGYEAAPGVPPVPGSP